MEINPQISVPIGAGKQGGVPIYNLSGRKLESGSIRLRDETLILTGVIQESDRRQAQSGYSWRFALVGQLFGEFLDTPKD